MSGFLGPLSDSDFQKGGNCYQDNDAYLALFPPYKIGGRLLTMDEHDALTYKGIKKWCTGCPIMDQCGKEARDREYSGTYGGRIFYDGKEVAATGPPAKPNANKAGAETRTARTAAPATSSSPYSKPKPNLTNRQDTPPIPRPG